MIAKPSSIKLRSLVPGPGFVVIAFYKHPRGVKAIIAMGRARDGWNFAVRNPFKHPRRKN